MDSRFHLTIHFEIYGEKYEWDCSLNWSAESGEVDPRIVEWFAECYDKAYAKWEAKNYEAGAGHRAAAEKKREIDELKRLCEKYPEHIPESPTDHNFR